MGNSRIFKLHRKKALSVFLMSLYFVFVAVFVATGFMPKLAGAESSKTLKIDSISLTSEAIEIKRNKNTIEAPDAEVGSYSQYKNKTLLIGHKATIFKNLEQVKLGDKIEYDKKLYVVKTIEISPKTVVNMDEIVEEAEVSTIILMTCHGEPLTNNDYTERLIITAEEIGEK